MATMERIVNRAANFAGSYGNVRMAPPQVDVMALAQLSATAAMHQIELFAHWCYQRNEAGRLIHILPNGQIPSGFFTPWGASGKSRMIRADRDALRSWLHILRERRQFPPWFYHGVERRWYVDLMRYDSLDDTLSWLAKHPIAPQDWFSLRPTRRIRA